MVIRLRNIIKKLVFPLISVVPSLILKIRAGISYKECRLFVEYYFCTAFLHKSVWNSIKLFFLLFFKLSWKNFAPTYAIFGKKYYKKKKEGQGEIGRWYSMSPEMAVGTIVKEDTHNTKYFSIGREAILHIIKSHQFDRKVALLPNFTCFTVLDPFIQEGWELHFYRYNKKLIIDTADYVDLFEKVKPSLCFFQSLSGMAFLDDESSLIEHAHQNGCVTVVDQTQDVYSERNNPAVDYYCGSLRKWYPFPDGAFVYSAKHAVDESEELEENIIFRTSMGMAMFAAHLRSVYDEPFFDYLFSFMRAIALRYIHYAEIAPHTMSHFSRKIFSQQDETVNSERRTNNFHLIYQEIQGLKKVKPAFGDIARITSVPLSFPIYVENRKDLCRLLGKRGICAQILWLKPQYIKDNIELDETSEYIYDHILSLPCDQRYDSADMKRMVDVLRAYDRET